MEHLNGVLAHFSNMSVASGDDLGLLMGNIEVLI